MKNPKVGEKVRVYYSEGCMEGKITKVANNAIKLADDTGTLGWYHRRQCVRLVPKKRMEFWIPRSWNGENLGLLRDKGNAWLEVVPPDYDDKARYIHVREVKKC